MTAVLTAVWWKAAGIRAARTALVIALPYVPASYLGDIPYVAIASAAALGAILSLLTSLAGLAEVEGTPQPWYFAILSRVVKSVAQAVVAGIGTAVLITDVNWSSILTLSLSAGFGSLLLAVLKQLPESETPSPVTPVVNVTPVVTIDAGTVTESQESIARRESLNGSIDSPPRI